MSQISGGARTGWPRAVAAALIVLALLPASARAVITEPIPADVALAPPPIPAMPVADPAVTPPDELIVDPVEPGATCGDWRLQTDYAGSWPAGSTWWEFQCDYEWPQCDGACEADWAPSYWSDYFYFDGTGAVFYGEFFFDYGYDSWYEGSGCVYWWDQPTGQWYEVSCPVLPSNESPTASLQVSCSGLKCAFDGRASSDPDGWIAAYSWDFGDGTTTSGATATHTYAAGTYTVTLTVIDDDGTSAVASAPLTVANESPAASFSVTCSALSCAFDGSGSTDLDGSLAAYEWEFGDGTYGSGMIATHTYGAPGTYTVRLTVRDDGGATATAVEQVTPLQLTAHGDKRKGIRKADLAWTGLSGATYDVFRDDVPIARVQATSYTDEVGRAPVSRYTYRVCTLDGSICSNEASVSF